jgi:hypothetical protein
MTITKKIESLTREQALEAASLLNHLIVEDNASSFSSENLNKLLENPYQNVAKIEELCKVILICAYYTPEYKEDTELILDSVGKKNFILGGTEIVAISTIAVAALHIILTRGKKSHEETMVVDTENGKVQSKTVKTEYYSFSDQIGSVIKDVFGMMTE